MFYHGTDSRMKGKGNQSLLLCDISMCSLLYNLAKRGDQRLSQPEAENKLGPGH